jgi:hypothetical protein
MLNEALTSCELGPPYLCRGQTKGIEGEGDQPGQQLRVALDKSWHTRGRAPGILYVQNRPCAEDVIRLHSALLDKKSLKERIKPHLLTGGGEEHANRLEGE